jgi:hypothetical protein
MSFCFILPNYLLLRLLGTVKESTNVCFDQMVYIKGTVHKRENFLGSDFEFCTFS